MASNAAAGSNATGNAFGTPAYRGYVLGTLTLVYTLNFIDRILIQILSEPIINEFSLTDFQFGILSGFGFAFFYTLCGIPIARLAERTNRVKIIAASVIIWSAMTALCGVAGSFLALLVFRVGVGIGEAGLTPPANSLIADYFPPRSRARAMGIYSMGITLGTVMAAAFGAPIAQAFTWREAFLVLGIPGVIVGLLVWFSVKEPPRGHSDPVGTKKLENIGFADTLKNLSSNKSYWINTAAATITAFTGYGMVAFQTSFFVRYFEMDLSTVAAQFTIPLGLAASVGAFLGGFLSEKLSGRFATAVAWFPGLGLILCIPFYWLGYASDTASITFLFLLAASMGHYLYLGAQFTICQGVVDARSRATAVAIMLFVVNLIGYGLGPLFVGMLSDYFASAHLAGSSFAGEMALTQCKGEAANVIANLGTAKAAFCQEVGAIGLQKALQMVSLFFGLAGLLYLWASRTLHRDMIAKMN